MPKIVSWLVLIIMIMAFISMLIAVNNTYTSIEVTECEDTIVFTIGDRVESCGTDVNIEVAKWCLAYHEAMFIPTIVLGAVVLLFMFLLAKIKIKKEV